MEELLAGDFEMEELPSRFDNSFLYATVDLSQRAGTSFAFISFVRTTANDGHHIFSFLGMVDVSASGNVSCMRMTGPSSGDSNKNNHPEVYYHASSDVMRCRLNVGSYSTYTTYMADDKELKIYFFPVNCYHTVLSCKTLLIKKA